VRIPAVKAIRVLGTVAAVLLLALAIEASSEGSGGGAGTVFTAAPQAPGKGRAVPGPGMAQAAAAAGFKPLLPGAPVIDLGAFVPGNALPDGVPFESFKVLGAFVYESDFEPWNDPFEEPKRRKHPKRSVPASVQALDGRRVACMGFMLPFDFKPEGTRHFGLMRNQVGCCFGQAPGLNEWVDVTVAGAPTEVFMDTPLLVVGTLKIKPIVEAGNTMGLYTLAAETIEKARVSK